MKEGAIPSILPQRPKCLSQPSTSTSRESRKDRNLRLKEEQFQQATEENVKLQKAYSEGKSFNNFEEFLVCLEKNTQFLNPNNDWVIVKQGQFVEFHIIKRDPIPKIMITVMINNLCDVRVFTDSTTELQKLQNFDLPFHIDSITHLDEILRLASQTPSNSSATLKFYIEAIQALFYNVIDLVPVEHKKRIEFLLEQVKFSLLNEIVEDTDMFYESILINNSVIYLISIPITLVQFLCK